MLPRTPQNLTVRPMRTAHCTLDRPSRGALTIQSLARRPAPADRGAVPGPLHLPLRRRGERPAAGARRDRGQSPVLPGPRPALAARTPADPVHGLGGPVQGAAAGLAAAR